MAMWAVSCVLLLQCQYRYPAVGLLAHGSGITGGEYTHVQLH